MDQPVKVFCSHLLELSNTQVEVSATLDGKAAAGPVTSELGSDLPRSYHEFLTGRGVAAAVGWSERRR